MAQAAGVQEHAPAHVVADGVGRGSRQVPPARVDPAGHVEEPARRGVGDEGAGGPDLGPGPSDPPVVGGRGRGGGERQHGGGEQQRQHQVRDVLAAAEPAGGEVGRGAAGGRRTARPGAPDQAQQLGAAHRNGERHEGRRQQREQLARLVTGREQVPDRSQRDGDHRAAHHQREARRGPAPHRRGEGDRQRLSDDGQCGHRGGGQRRRHDRHQADHRDGVQPHRDAGVQPAARDHVGGSQCGPHPHGDRDQHHQERLAEREPHHLGPGLATQLGQRDVRTPDLGGGRDQREEQQQGEQHKRHQSRHHHARQQGSLGPDLVEHRRHVEVGQDVRRVAVRGVDGGRLEARGDVLDAVQAWRGPPQSCRSAGRCPPGTTATSSSRAPRAGPGPREPHRSRAEEARRGRPGR